MPGNRSFTEPSEFSVYSVPSSLKMTSVWPVWRIALILTDGSPIRNGPDQLAATFGSEVTLRTTLLTVSAAQSSVATTSNRYAPKPVGRVAWVHVPVGVRSHRLPMFEV